MKDKIKDTIIKVQPISISTSHLRHHDWKMWTNIFSSLFAISVFIGVTFIVPYFYKNEANIINDNTISFIIIYQTNVSNGSLLTISDFNVLTASLNDHLGLSNVNINAAKFKSINTIDDEKRRETTLNLNLCENARTDTMGDLFILDLSIEYQLEYTGILDQQHFFDKIKMNNSSAYEQFILPIILTNQHTLDVKMSLCSFSQVISSESTHTADIQKRNLNNVDCNDTTCLILTHIQSESWNVNTVLNSTTKSTFGPCQGGLYPNDDKCVAYTYGSDPIQVIDCHLPKGPYVPLVVLLIHGGYWSAKLNRSIENAVGNDLLRFNIVVCNLDYRSVGNGGGYPNTFYDVANGTDLLRTIAQEHGFNSSRVIVVGHSAGGQLGGYITGRFRLLPTQPGYSTDPLRPIAYVSQAGVNNMWDGCDQAAETGSGAVISFLGGTYPIFPERYVLSSLAASSNLTVRAQYPSQFLPLEVPIQAITGSADITLPISQTINFAKQANAAGDNCTEVIVEGEDHFVHLNISSKSWNRTLTFILSFIPY